MHKSQYKIRDYKVYFTLCLGMLMAEKCFAPTGQDDIDLTSSFVNWCSILRLKRFKNIDQRFLI